MKKKLISYCMIIVLLVGLVQGGIGSVVNASGEASDDYIELSLKDFGVDTYKEMLTDGETIETESKASLNGVAVTGIYKMTENAQFFVGENWKGMHVSVWETSLCIVPYSLGNTNSTGLYFDITEYGYTSWKDRNIEIRLSFKFENENGNRADVLVKAAVDGHGEKEIQLLGADTTALHQSIGTYLPDGSSKLTVTEPEYLVQKLTMTDFAVETYKEMTTDGEVIATESKGSLDGTSITGVYNFKGNGQLFVGENWKAIQVSIYEKTLCVVPYGLGNTNTAAIYFAAAEYGYNSWTDRNIQINITFDFKNIAGDKADVEVRVSVDDHMPKVMLIEQANTTTLYQSIGVYLPDANSAVTVMTTEYAITQLTLNDFGVDVSKVMQIDGESIQTESKGTLDGTAVTGIYYFTGNAQVFIGENWHAIALSVYEESLCVVPTLLDNTNSAALYFNISDFGYTAWTERDIKVCMAFDFKNISGNKADVIVKVTVDDLVEKEMILTQATITTLYQSIGVYLPDANSTVTFTNPDYEPATVYEELSLKDFGISHSKNIKTDGMVIKTISADTLDGKAVTGLYKLFGDAQFFIGESWKGLQVSVYENTLCIVPYSLANSNTAALYFDLSEFENYTSWKECDIKIRAAFEFENILGDKADVVVKITIDDVVTKTMILEDADTAPLCQSIGVYLPNEESKITMTEPNPDAEPDYEVFTLEDYGFKGYTSVNDETVLKELSSEQTLDGTAITGDYKFSPNGSIVCFGGYWTGVRVQSLDNGKFEVRFQLEGVEQYIDDVFGNIVLTPEDAGMTLTDRIINLKMGFEVTEQEGTMGTLVVRMTVDNNFTQQYTFKNVPLTYTKQIMMAWSGENGTVILNASSEIPEAPTVNPSFKQLTFDSYLIYSGNYGYDGSKDLAASGNCGLNNLDGVVFSDTIHMTDKPGAQLFIGGKTNGWEGMLLASAENGNLVLIYGSESVLFTSAKAGTQLTDNDVKVTFSFEYVDADQDGAKDDVKLGVWFNGKAYNNKWIYLNDYAEQLGGFIGIYSASEGASLTVKTYNAPIDFAIWGFTKYWAKTLGLI